MAMKPPYLTPIAHLKHAIYYDGAMTTYLSTLRLKFICSTSIQSSYTVPLGITFQFLSRFIPRRRGNSSPSGPIPYRSWSDDH